MLGSFDATISMTYHLQAGFLSVHDGCQHLLGLSCNGLLLNSREFTLVDTSSVLVFHNREHCIQAALACGISGDELRTLVIEAEKAQAAGEGGWYPSVLKPKE